MTTTETGARCPARIKPTDMQRRTMRAIIRLKNSGKVVNGRTLGKAMGLPVPTANSRLALLADAGFITRAGDGHQRPWVILRGPDGRYVAGARPANPRNVTPTVYPPRYAAGMIRSTALALDY